MAQHEAALVKDLEGKGEDDDAQEAHHEVPSTVHSSSLRDGNGKGVWHHDSDCKIGASQV